MDAAPVTKSAVEAQRVKAWMAIGIASAEKDFTATEEPAMK